MKQHKLFRSWTKLCSSEHNFFTVWMLRNYSSEAESLILDSSVGLPISKMSSLLKLKISVTLAA